MKIRLFIVLPILTLWPLTPLSFMELQAVREALTVSRLEPRAVGLLHKLKTVFVDTLVPDVHAGAFFQLSDTAKADAVDADKIAIELRVELQLLVKVKPDVDADVLLRAQGATRIEEISPRLFLVDFADLAARSRAEKALSTSPQVEYAEPNRVVSRPRTR